jgi:hypothetical protein
MANRFLSGHVRIAGTDDESIFESDEHIDATRAVQTVVGTDQPAVHLSIEPVRWGGECRVELDLTAVTVGNGDVQISGTAKLFEGTSENTTDMEEQKDFNFLVPRNTTINTEAAQHNVQLSSDGWGGGDHAEIGAVFTNVIIEEE